MSLYSQGYKLTLYLNSIGLTSYLLTAVAMKIYIWYNYYKHNNKTITHVHTIIYYYIQYYYIQLYTGLEAPT